MTGIRNSIRIGFALVSLVANIGLAERPPINQEKVLKVEFARPAWNKNPTEAESQLIFISERARARSAAVQLLETEPNSGVFTGTYMLNFGKGDRGAKTSENARPEDLLIEVFAPTENYLKSSQTKLSLKELQRRGELERKPFILQKLDGGVQKLTLFSTKEEAQRALEAIKMAKRAKNGAPTSGAAASDLELGEAASSLLTPEQVKKIEAEKKKLLSAQLQREIERKKLEELEREKLERQRAAQLALDEKERQRRVELANQYAEAALDQYRLNNFSEAVTNFAKSVELDPANTNYYYQYGVTLYRLGRFNDSIVTLKNAQGSGFDPLERDFYVALNHYQLKEYPLAIQEFEKIRSTKDPKLGASGAFYIGLINFDGTKYERAKQSFQEVLDTSQDPRLDEKAEAMMEQIDKIMEYAKLRKTKFFVQLVSGIQYDSNILLVADSNPQQASPSEIGDNRFVGGGSVYWRPIFDQKYEFGVKAKADVLYTFRTQFAQADPLLYNLTAPFVLKSQIFNKSIRSEIRPGYEILNLDTTNSGSKKAFMNSILMDWNNSLVMNDNWISSYNLRFRRDDFPDAASQNANRYTLNLNNIYFLDPKKTRGVIGDLGYTLNDASGT